MVIKSEVPEVSEDAIQSKVLKVNLKQELRNNMLLTTESETLKLNEDAT